VWTQSGSEACFEIKKKLGLFYSAGEISVENSSKYKILLCSYSSER
jgi:hypothetical protein